MTRQRKRRTVVRFPAPGPRAKEAGPDRKLSDIIKEMGLRVLKNPDATPSFWALEAVVFLASAAWNAALGDPGLQDRCREILGRPAESGCQPWPELVSRDLDVLLAQLVEYKEAHHPADRRRIVRSEVSGKREDANIRVIWTEGNTVVTPSFGSRASVPAAVGARSRRPIAEKLVAKMKRKVRGKVVDLASVIAGRAAAEELQKKVATIEDLAKHDPAHAAYVYAQNQVAVMTEQLTALKEMDPLSDLFSRAEDLYLPSGPPMSPLTRSYFSCWAFFDACMGPERETFGTTTLEVGAAFGMHPELLHVIQLMQDSRMGLYLHEGTDGSVVVLRELVTDAVCRAISPSGYRGERGELWYARVLPPPLPGGSEHVVFTTPYVLIRPGPREWQAYFQRTLPEVPRQALLEAFERHMKYGPTQDYWNEFVFEAYVNYKYDVIYLRGLPDVPESRPHSRVNSHNF